MSRPTAPRSDASARAFARVGWPRVWKNLYDYARTLGLAPTGAKRAGVIEANDPVNRVIERSLAGDLDCDLPDDAPDSRVLAWARGKVQGTYWTMRRADGRVFEDETLDELADGRPDALSLLLGRQSVEEALHALAPDAEASAYAKLMLLGNKRADIMEELHIDDDRYADVVYRRILRTLAALHAGQNDNREERPSGTVPRGDCHDPQTSQERSGADGEPRRGALRAGPGRR